MAQSEGRKIKGGKPIGRQQDARKRRMPQLNAYFSRLRQRKLAQVKKSNGPTFAKAWAKKYLYSAQPKA